MLIVLHFPRILKVFEILLIFSLVKMPSLWRKLQFLDRLREFALLLPPGLPRVDAFIYTPEEFELMRERKNPLIMKVLSEGEVVYEAS